MTVYENSKNFQKDITIIGGGLVGASIATMFLRRFKEHFSNAADSLPSVTLNIVDPAKEIGPGMPYSAYGDNEADYAIFLNNQPGSRMSFDPHDPMEFCRFINPQDPESERHKFHSRLDTGLYVKASLKEAVEALERANINVNLRHLQAKASKIEATDSGFRYALDDGSEQRQTDILVVSDGHQLSGFLKEYRDQPDFFDTPYNIQAVRDVLSGHQQDDIAIIGTGQSSVDVHTVLNHIGFEGRRFMFSRSNVHPWEFKPEEHPVESDQKPYQFKFLTPDAVSDLVLPTREDLSLMLNLEIAAAAFEQQGKGHVLAKLELSGIEKALNGNEQNRMLFNAFKQQVKSLYGNPTPKVRYEMLQDLRKNGRILDIQQAVNVHNMSRDENGYVFDTKDGPLKVRAVFNTATLARAGLDADGVAFSPLLAELNGKNLIKPDPDRPESFICGQQDNKKLYLACGPSTSTEKWGVETFREGNSRIASQLIEDITCQYA